jgi:hypothetical protein
MSRRFGAIISGSIIFLLLLPFAGIAKGGGSRLRNSAVSIGGWVSDSGCGTDHTKLGGVSCVRKCLAGGASVGHTEWKPQKMVLVEDTDKSVWTVQNPAALKGSEGRHLIITGFLNRKKRQLKVVAIESVIE